METITGYYDESELVDECFGCPSCGNRVIDSLDWDDDYELVDCGACGTRYNPANGEVIA